MTNLGQVQDQLKLLSAILEIFCGFSKKSDIWLGHALQMSRNTFWGCQNIPLAQET